MDSSRPFREPFSESTVCDEFESSRSQQRIEGPTLVEDVHDRRESERGVGRNALELLHGVGKELLHQSHTRSIEAAQVYEAGMKIHELGLQSYQDLAFFVLPPLPPRLKSEREQDRAYDHHAFDDDAEPGDLGLQSATWH